jgi:hypothetical protein
MLIMTDRCVFCGNPIGPDEARTGRGASAAHAACADDALGDDAHWDEIARASGVDETPAAPSGRSRGCLTVVAIVLIVAVALAAAVGFAPF